MNARLCLVLACWLTAIPGLRAGETSAGDATALARKIDQHIARRQADLHAEPAPLADDAEFLRRVYLDLAGRIPAVEETRTFLADSRPDKRAQLVEELLRRPRYVAHFTNVWRALLLPEANNNFQVRILQGQFETWLRQQLARNAGYDQIVRTLLTTPVTARNGNPFDLQGDAAPMTFYFAKELKPENLAASTARVFLGVSVECAQCHNHPFAEWKREQFWGFAAFFSGIQAQRQMDFILPGKEEASKREMTIPGTGKVVQATFLDGTQPVWKPETKARATLADWLTAPTNPYFARATVNRLWSYFLGTGLVEPVDEMVGGTSTSSHPELLDLLAQEFAAHQFDMKFLIRAITASQAYQRTSATTHKSQGDPSLFARMPLRGLTPEQLFDSVALATGYRDSGGGDDIFSSFLGGARSARSEFLTRFAYSERATEAQTSILQALSLMNGKVVAAATSLERSETLAAVVDAPFLGTVGRVEALYIATLSRRPEARELDRAVRFVKSAAREDNALADLFWALLNSPEFILNH